jgi:type IV secretion system protein VirB11
VSGGTGSGKTTLLNSLLREIDNNDRIVTLEDSKELIIKQPNHIRLLKSKTGTDVAKLTYKEYSFLTL